ncbi:MAG: hypothetical protein ACOYON_02430 [Fimbriimonas sp.]
MEERHKRENPEPEILPDSKSKSMDPSVEQPPKGLQDFLSYQVRSLWKQIVHKWEFILLLTVAALLAFVFRAHYQPFVSWAGLIAIVYAIEHLGGLGHTQKSLTTSTNDLKRLLESLNDVDSKIAATIQSIRNEMGTGSWREQVRNSLRRGFRIIEVCHVWDDQPTFSDSLPRSIGAFRETTEFGRAPEGSLLRDLEVRYLANPVAKYTVVGKLDPAGTEILLPTQVPSNLNALSLMWRLVQVRKFNLSIIQRCRRVEQELQREISEMRDSEATSMPIQFDHSVSGYLSSKDDLMDLKLCRTDRFSDYFDLVATFGNDTQKYSFPFCTTRPYQVYTLICSTVPWITLLGSPNAKIKNEIFDFNRFQPETLEASYAVALVDGQQVGEIKSLSPSAIQLQAADYAFDLVADAGSKPFEDHADFKSRPDASSTQLKLRALDRSLRAEVRHSVPMELYLVGQLMWLFANDATPSRLEEKVLKSDLKEGPTILRLFLDQEIELGKTKNGEIPSSLANDQEAALIWRSL